MDVCSQISNTKAITENASHLAFRIDLALAYRHSLVLYIQTY